ncbi:unnamed protein product [Clonostachys chloroleuca]|uniref:Uncharacterized protein n=1 Tax=Clonostachys chloroleuca TaxID=1926264 RepID=A0AA35LWT4_9HYPO|nr:unnamed protein product [Clonostachys chloroleuca]
MDGRESLPGFFRIPCEIRDQIYEELLVHSGCIFLDVIWSRPASLGFTFNNRLLPISPEILRLNRRTHEEATHILYGKNKFQVENVNNFTRFLGDIGPANSALLRHLIIPFPYFKEDDGVVAVRDDSIGMQAIDLIQSKCHNIVVLETCLFSSNLVESKLDASGHPEAANQALDLFMDNFCAVPSFRHLRVNLFDKPVSLVFRDILNNHRRVLVVTNMRLSD